MEVETDLRTTSDRILKTLEELEALENEKRQLPVGSPRFQELADSVSRLAASVFAQSQTQQTLGDKAQEVRDRTGVELPSIEESEQTRELPLILADWRDAERRLIAAKPDSAELSQAKADVRRLRDEYQRAHSASASELGD